MNSESENASTQESRKVINVRSEINLMGAKIDVCNNP